MIAFQSRDSVFPASYFNNVNIFVTTIKNDRCVSNASIANREQNIRSGSNRGQASRN